MENALSTLDKAASVGPQGSYFDYHTAKDIMYFDKGSFNNPLVVDAVSGFLFAINLKLVEDKLLKFENQYTPCYFEEWDLGLQIKKAGYRSYIVPTTDYAHHWSGSIKSMTKIKYYGDTESTAPEINTRNRYIFWDKWDKITKDENCTNILKTEWERFGIKYGEKLLESKMFNEAIPVYQDLVNRIRNNAILLTNLGIAYFASGQKEDASVNLNKALEINPEIQLAKQYLNKL